MLKRSAAGRRAAQQSYGAPAAAAIPSGLRCWVRKSLCRVAADALPGLRCVRDLPCEVTHQSR
ncbi:hypothetical protein MJ561_09705 [Klebsiella pneumoniae]|nr:hypothetical protein MJ561_09705 [Klebsiella pneumoniae]